MVQEGNNAHWTGWGCNGGGIEKSGIKGIQAIEFAYWMCGIRDRPTWREAVRMIPYF